MNNSRYITSFLTCAFCLLRTSTATLSFRLQAKVSGENDYPERGDVAAWVMITLLSAVLAAALLVLAGPALEALFNHT